jgi:hypothetical protein
MQRKNRTYGYFSGERWNDQAGAVTDKIALNPAHFTTRSTEEVLSTLAHEMVHLWQHHCGTPSRSAYHNKEWAAKMDAIGLCLSHTRAPGGKRTGQHMSHYVVAGGPFAQACTDLLAEGFVISCGIAGGRMPLGRERREGKQVCAPNTPTQTAGSTPGRRQTWCCAVARVRWRWNRRTPEGQQTQDTDAPLARLVGPFQHTGRKGPPHVFSAAH